MSPCLPHHKFQEITKLTLEHLFEIPSIEKKWRDKWIKNLRQRLEEKEKVAPKSKLPLIKQQQDVHALNQNLLCA